VNKRKIRAKDAVNTVWWFSKSDNPKADVRKVLTPYSARMNALLKDATKFYKPKLRPSGHDISKASIGTTGARFQGFESHPARFPQALPQFFIEFLTDAGDVVVDIFSGSNTTGHVAKALGRRWVSIEVDREFAMASALRFMEGWDQAPIRRVVAAMRSGKRVELAKVKPDSRLPFPPLQFESPSV